MNFAQCLHVILIRANMNSLMKRQALASFPFVYRHLFNILYYINYYANITISVSQFAS